MKVGLITTTIHVPHVLRLYRRYGPDVKFFVAIDKKTPDEACEFLGSIPDLDLIRQTDYKCDALIGWNSIQRRNLALLEALRWGAEIIISCDDDNLPIDEDYFRYFAEVLDPDMWIGFRRQPFSGLCATGGWFDPGALLSPSAPHRGFPVTCSRANRLVPVIDAKIGVAAGVCLGDPDTSAYWRMAHRPIVHQTSQLLEAGVVFSPRAALPDGRQGGWTVFNSQNTAIIRELAPAWSMWVGVSRYDDILASLVVQRVMRERGYHVHFGKPFVWQQRNEHDLQKDLEGEIWGMRRITEIADFLDSLPPGLSGESVIDHTREIFIALQKLPWLPPVTSAAALAFLDDCEGAM